MINENKQLQYRHVFGVVNQNSINVYTIMSSYRIKENASAWWLQNSFFTLRCQFARKNDSMGRRFRVHQLYLIRVIILARFLSNNGRLFSLTRYFYTEMFVRSAVVKLYFGTCILKFSPHEVLII